MAAAPRLGLALSGGGFRASFFHIGVLRRLAELDLLRHVAVLSTVSGGSVVAGHYLLRLRARVGETPALTTADYVAIVDTVAGEFRRGARRNLRTRLFADPLQNLRHLITRRSLGRRMAELYQTHLYRDAARAVRPALERRVPLGLVRAATDPEAFAGPAADALVRRMPKWVINATCLNSGRGFRFTMSEIGDPLLGFIRFDEAHLVLAAKRLLADPKGWRGPAPLADASGWHLAWWQAMREALAAERAHPGNARAGPQRLAADVGAARTRLGAPPPALGVLLGEVDQAPDWEASRALAVAEPGMLRRMKIAAFRLRRGDPVEAELWRAVEDVDEQVGARLRHRLTGLLAPSFADLVLDTYRLRSAELFAWSAANELNRLTLADAVAASANFPPVFPPFTIHGLYDPERAWALALTDGGVDDNQGLTALLDEGCTHVIASDAGGLLRVAPRPPTERLGMMARIADTLMGNVRALQLHDLRERRRVTGALASLTGAPDPPPIADLRLRYGVEGAAFFHMSTPPDAAYPPTKPDPLPPHPEAEAVAALRTDLDAFHDTEIDGLIYQGYQLADRFVRQHAAPAFGVAVPPTITAPVSLPSEADDRGWDATARVLRAGRARLFRAFALSLPLRLAALALVGVALWVLWRAPQSIAAAWRWTDAQLLAVARHPLLFPVLEVPLEQPGTVRWAAIGLVVLLALWFVWPRIEMRLADLLAARVRGTVAKARAVRAAEALGLWRRQVWWFAGLAPLWLAVGGAMLAWWVYALDAIALRLRRVGTR